MWVAAVNPTTSVVEPPPRATIDPSRPIVRADHSRSRTAGVFAASPAGHLVLRDVPCPESHLRADAVDARDVRVGDELDRAVPGNELPQLVDRAERDVDARGGEQNAVDVVGVGVCDLLVERLPVAVERVELLGRPRQRPLRAGHPLPGHVRVDVEEDRERARSQVASRPLGEHRAASQSDHRRVSAAKHLAGHLLLDLSEARLAPGREQLRDRLARPLLDLLVEIDEASPEPRRDGFPGARLPGAHEPGERQVAAERVERPHAASSAISDSSSHGT